MHTGLRENFGGFHHVRCAGKWGVGSHHVLPVVALGHWTVRCLKLMGAGDTEAAHRHGKSDMGSPEALSSSRHTVEPPGP